MATCMDDNQCSHYGFVSIALADVRLVFFRQIWPRKLDKNRQTSLTEPIGKI